METPPFSTHSCDYHRRQKCRSCGLMESPYEEGLKTKAQILDDLFPGVPALPMVASPKVLASRNKAKMVVSGTMDRPIIGLGTPDYRGSELLSCPLHEEEVNRLLQSLRQLIPLMKLAPYHVGKKTGELKFIIIQRTANKGELILRFVLRSPIGEDRIRKIVPLLVKSHPSLRIISANLQPIHQAILEGPSETVLWSHPTRSAASPMVRHQLGPLTLHQQARGFFQTNSEVALKLYSYVGEVVSKIRPAQLLDLYCGIGAFSFYASPWAGEVTGVELSPEAIVAAELSRQTNKVGNVRFLSADVEKFLKEWSGPEKLDLTVIVNPPRSGLTEEVVRQLIMLGPEVIIYSSCNPQTLKRDCERLAGSYRQLHLRAFDMFPLTHHMEVVTVMERISTALAKAKFMGRISESRAEGERSRKRS